MHPDKIFKNYGSRPGDVLILTKQIGSGIVNTAIKAEMASEAAIKEAITVMSSLNKKGKEVVEHYPVTACTDITGFGLLGHCVEMASASDVTFELQVKDIAYLEEAVSYAKMGLVPAGAYKNREYSAEMVDMEHVEEHYIDLLYDPQTSGGLLFAVPQEEGKAFRQELKEAGLPAQIVGRLIKQGDAGFQKEITVL